MENFFSNTNLLRIILKWKWHLILIVIVSALISMVVSSSMVIKPRFKSVALIYPSNILPYSDESETEQMLQWINSSDVRDSVIKKFDLAKHYKISPGDKFYASVLEDTYNGNVTISKTPFESIQVAVSDLDPVMARDIVNGILDFTDYKIRATQRIKYMEVYEALGKRLAAKKAEIDSVKTLYRTIATKYGIYDVEGQSQEITRGELRTVDGGGGNINSKDVVRLKQGMMDKAGDLLYLSNRISLSSREYSEIILKYEASKFEIDKKFTFINIVTPPVVADKKYYPRRLFVLFYFVAGSLLVSLLAIAFFEVASNPRSEIKNG
jgi:capsular polysaccharide biosynthesis protein